LNYQTIKDFLLENGIEISEVDTFQKMSSELRARGADEKNIQHIIGDKESKHISFYIQKNVLVFVGYEKLRNGKIRYKTEINDIVNEKEFKLTSIKQTFEILKKAIQSQTSISDILQKEILLKELVTITKQLAKLKNRKEEVIKELTNFGVLTNTERENAIISTIQD